MTEVLGRELKNLETKCNLDDWHGALLAVKDSYEIPIKFSCLVVCALSYQDLKGNHIAVIPSPSNDSYGPRCPFEKEGGTLCD